MKPFLTGEKRENPLQESIYLQKTLVEEVKSQKALISELISLAKETRDLAKVLVFNFFNGVLYGILIHFS